MSNEVISNYPKLLKAEMGKDAIIPGSAISPFKTSTPEGYEAEGGSSMEKVRTEYPPSRKAPTTRGPTAPVAPVTIIFI